MTDSKDRKGLKASEIEQELQSHLKSLKTSGNLVSRANSRVFVIFGSVEEQALAASLCDSILKNSPGRAFMILIDNTLDKLEISVEVKTVELNEEEFVSSDIIVFKVPDRELNRIPSILFARSFAGVVPTLVVATGSPRVSLLDPFIDLGSTVVFDSRYLFERVVVLNHFLKKNRELELVDLAWIRSSIWRGEIREIFARPGINNCLSGLRQIDIEVVELDDAPELWLLAGWLLDQLDLELMAAGRDGFECRSSNGSKLILKLVKSSTNLPEAVAGMRFVFDDGQIHIQRGEFFESQIDLHYCYRLSARNHFLSTEECIENFYTVGESTENYRSSLAVGLELFSLRQGLGGV